jgi:hypothetical protein
MQQGVQYLGNLRWPILATLAASEHLQALSEQLKSVALGNGFEFETEIHAARQRKDEAKFAVLNHESEHGCNALRLTKLS